jgi:hypothetical protein
MIAFAICQFKGGHESASATATSMIVTYINNRDFKLIFHAKHIKIEFAMSCIRNLPENTVIHIHDNLK